MPNGYYKECENSNWLVWQAVKPYGLFVPYSSKVVASNLVVR